MTIFLFFTVTCFVCHNKDLIHDFALKLANKLDVRNFFKLKTLLF